MKYLKLYESYLGRKDQDHGSSHEIAYLDNEWVLKSPFNSRIQSKSGFHDPNITQNEVLTAFKKHILTMKKFPAIFPNVKILDKYRAIIERLNGREADDQLDHIRNLIFTKKFELFPAEKLYNSPTLLDLLKEQNDLICSNWYQFIIKLKNANLENYIGRKLDLADSNFGIDKKGNIKLLDF